MRGESYRKLLHHHSLLSGEPAILISFPNTLRNSSMANLLPDQENQAVETWFSDLKKALDLSPNADRGRVLARVTKLVAEMEGYEKEKQIVSEAYGYKRWGDLCRHCVEQERLITQ